MRRLIFLLVLIPLLVAPAYAADNSGWDLGDTATGAGTGDMTKAVYDANSNNVVDTATALAANGANCSSGSAPLGVDAAGAVESCFAVQPSDADLVTLAAPTAWRMFYSDGSSVITELALGALNTVLTSGGATAAPTWAAAGAGSGDVLGPATSVDNTLPRFNGTNNKTIQGSGVVVDDSNNISGVGTFAGGVVTGVGGFIQGETLGPELITNGDFATGTCDGWTLTSGWTCSSGSALKNAGGLGAVSPTTPLTLAVGVLYKVVFTIKTTTVASYLTPSIGGAGLGNNALGDGTYTEYVSASATTNLAFTPATGFRGAIDDVSVRAVTCMITPSSGPVMIAKTLSDPQADQTAVRIDSTVNKAAGTVTSLVVNSINTALPGTMNHLDLEADGVSVFNFKGTTSPALTMTGSSSITATAALTTTSTTASFKYSADTNLTTGIFLFTQSSAANELTASSGMQPFILATPEILQTGSAGYSTISANPTESSVGTGSKRLFEGQLASVDKWNVTSTTHENATGTAPSLGTCGNTPSITGNDHAGFFTIGATGTGCVLTFATAYTNAPACVASGAAAITNSTSNTALTVTAVPGTYHYICNGLGE